MNTAYDISSPLQQGFRDMARKIDEQAEQYMEVWREKAPVEGFDTDNFWSRANLELVRDAEVPDREIHAYIVTGIYQGAPDAYWYFANLLDEDFHVCPNALIYSPSIDTNLNVHFAVSHLDAEHTIEWILAMWNGVDFYKSLGWKK